MYRENLLNHFDIRIKVRIDDTHLLIQINFHEKRQHHVNYYSLKCYTFRKKIHTFKDFENHTLIKKANFLWSTNWRNISKQCIVGVLPTQMSCLVITIIIDDHTQWKIYTVLLCYTMYPNVLPLLMLNKTLLDIRVLI